MSMQLKVNGQIVEHRGDGSLLALLDEMQADPERVVLVVNDRVIRSEAIASSRIAHGDRVEILVFAGGG